MIVIMTIDTFELKYQQILSYNAFNTFIHLLFVYFHPYNQIFKNLHYNIIHV